MKNFKPSEKFKSDIAENFGSRANGFTLVELIVSTFIFAIIAGGVAIFSAYYFRNYSFSFDEAQVVNQAQYGMTTLLREIREARSGDNGAWPLVQTDDNTFIFYSDVTNDGRSDRVRYFLNGKTVQKGVIQPTQVPVSYPAQNEVVTNIATNVDTSTGPLFKYYNGNWPGDLVNNPLPASQRQLNTRYVEVNLTINIASTSAGKVQPFKLSSGVQIRSLKDNL